MIFFKKKNTIVLDCFTWSNHAYEYAKIDHAIKYIPDWWKNTPKTMFKKEHATIKNCPGFIDLYKKGIVIPSWFDIELCVYEKNNSEGNWFAFNASNEDVSTSNSHEPYQFDGFCESDGKNLKFTSPWRFKTNENVNFLCSQPTWNHRSLIQNMTFLPGIVNFKYQNDTDMNYFVISGTEKKFLNIESLTPLVIMHPLTEKNIVIKNHLVTKEEYDKKFQTFKGMFLSKTKDHLINLYKKRKKLVNKLDDIKKCPFHND
jgi:hypothetical protein